MKVIKSTMVFGAVICLVAMVLFSACERKITNVIKDESPAGCFGCHSDEDTRLVSAEGQWQNSVHASGANTDRNYSSCVYCHTSQGFVAKAEGLSEFDASNPSAIHCFTCHAPHSEGDFELRVTEAQTLQNGESFDLGAANICVSCHQSRRNVNTYTVEEDELSEHWGPHHSPQGDMLIGTNGYEFDFYGTYPKSLHRGITENGCLDCHMSAGNYFLGGHSFNMEFAAGEEEEYNLSGCDATDCHDGAFGDLEDGFNLPYAGTTTGIQDTVMVLVEELRGLLQSANLLTTGDDPHPVEDRLVASTDSLGAVWNYMLIEEDRSHGIHNPKYAVALLRSAIQFMSQQPTVSRR